VRDLGVLALLDFLLPALLPALAVVAALLSPFLIYVQTGNKNKTALMETLAKELEKPAPVAYIVESCVSRLHNSRALPWDCLQIILRYSNAWQIISLISTGRRVLDLFEVSVTDNRVSVQYSRWFSSRRDRNRARGICLALAAFFLLVFAFAYVDVLKLLSGEQGQTAGLQDRALRFCYLLFQMFVYAGFLYLFCLLQIIIGRSENRLNIVNTLICQNLTLPAPETRSQIPALDQKTPG